MGKRGPHPTVPGKPYLITIPVRLNQQAVDALDRLRGKKGRSTYMRELLRRDAQEKLKGQQ